MAVVTDIRIQDTFFDNRKIVRLKRKLGSESLLCLIRLWMYTAKNSPKGVLWDMNDEDIEIAAGWIGDADVFVQALIEFDLLDTVDGVRAIHDWENCQPWAFKSDVRSERAQKGGVGKAKRVLEAEKSVLEADYKQTTSTLQAPKMAAPLLSSPLPSSPNTLPQAEPAGLTGSLELVLEPPPAKRPGAIAGTIAARFEQFWAVVKKRVEKKAAFAEFKRLAPDDDLLVTMVAAMKIYSAFKELEFQKAPHRWIKGECWNDELSGAGGGGSASSAWKGAEN